MLFQGVLGFLPVNCVGYRSFCGGYREGGVLIMGWGFGVLGFGKKV